ncbi:MAG: hypothetical protein KAG95_03580 [Bacteroidales bacterium]|nr:hypothetical protein [Bacteroidales bacterium]
MVFKYLRNAVLLIILFLISKEIYSQNNTHIVDKQLSVSHYTIDFKNYNNKLFADVFLEKVNSLRERKSSEILYVNDILIKIAQDQASYMSDIEQVSHEQIGKDKKTYQLRSKYYGGSINIEEIVVKIPIKKGKDIYTYNRVADDLVFKIYSNKKNFNQLINIKYNFIGIGSEVDKKGNQLYTSIILGNYNSLNAGAVKRNELKILFTIKQYGLKSYDKKLCKKCDNYKNIEDLQKALYVKENKIFFSYDKLKELKKIINQAQDAIAVDVVQEAQYLCNGDNIVDNNLFNRGILLKKVYSKKLYKNFQLKKDETLSKNKDVELGEIPYIKGDYELNLLLIKDNHVCKNIKPSYVIFSDSVEYKDNVELLADTITTENISNYFPKASTEILHFKIPFKKNKYIYKNRDIEPFIKSLNIPDFNIDEINLYAYSSIEGSDKGNITLQQKRAKSIVDALNKEGRNNIKINIKTGYNWNKFKEDIAETKYNFLATKTLQKAREYIRRNNLEDTLESVFLNHRYANIEMKVTYKIAGKDEQQFVLYKFNQAVKKDSLAEALSIQKYIFKKILKNKYTSDAIEKQAIPYTTKTAGLLMNKLWLEIYKNKRKLADSKSDVYKLFELRPSNNYIFFNKTFCDIMFENLNDKNNVAQIQNSIQNLYLSNFPKETIDALNLKFQFKIINDNSNKSLVNESLNSIKNIIDIKNIDMKNSLNLSYIFINNKDYNFAIKLLEHFIYKKDVSEEVLFTYISLCSHFEDINSTQRFEVALRKASKMDKQRYCKLFDGSKLSFQIFENIKIKQDYCKECVLKNK